MTGRVHVDSSAAICASQRRGNGKLRHVRVGDIWIQEKEGEGDVDLCLRVILEEDDRSGKKCLVEHLDEFIICIEMKHPLLILVLKIKEAPFRLPR